MRSHTLRPQITIAHSEYAQLFALAAAGSAADTPSAAEALLMEIERARVVPDAKLKPDVVRMGSRVQYRTDRDDRRRHRRWRCHVRGVIRNLTLAFVGAPRQQNGKGYCQEKRASRNSAAGAQAIDVGYACHASSFQEFAQETNRLGDVAVGAGARAHGVVPAAKGRRFSSNGDLNFRDLACGGPSSIDPIRHLDGIPSWGASWPGWMVVRVGGVVETVYR